MKNTKDPYLQLVQAFDLSTTDRQETPQLRNSTTKKLHNYIKQKVTLVQKPGDVLNKIDLVNKG